MHYSPPAVALPWCALLVCACFESGPLELGAGATTGPADGTGPDTRDTTDVIDTIDTIAETVAPEDTAPDADTSADTRDADTHDDNDADAGDATDADTLDALDALDTSAPEVRACLVDGDCAGVAPTDLCAGAIRCIDYGCRPDPALAVQCESPSACVASRCDPSTGECVEEQLCSCDTDHTLRCGVPASWTVGQSGSQAALGAYACGPAAASPTMRLFDLEATGRVRVSSSGDVRGLHVLSGEVCDGVTGCLAGAASILYFDAAPGGERYTLAVEEGDDNELLSVRADCDVTREEACKDGLDDDGDGATDCDDRDCNGIAGCALPPETEDGLCGDSLDNDLDQLTDCDDDDCFGDGGCLESCELVTRSVYCNYSQGLDNGSGAANATHYACNPVPQTARELVFPITAGFSGPLRIGFQSQAGLVLHLLAETGRGCTPRDCIEMSTGDLTFDIVEGRTYYLAVDGPGSLIGSFYIEIDCLL